MGFLTVTENALWFERRGEVACLTAYGSDVLRFRSSANATLADEDWTLLPQPIVPVRTAMSLDGHFAWIENGCLRAEITDYGKVTYYKKTVDNYEILLEEITEYAFDMMYRTYRSKGSDTHEANVLFAADESEHFYGLGGERNGCFDRKGSVCDLQQRNTKTTIPFVYSSKNYGFLWNNPSVGRCELTRNHTRWTAYNTKQVDYLVIGGDTPAQIMGRYADLTGHTPAFPAFAAGFWQSRLRYESQDDLLEVAREYKQRGIPLSVIVIDYFHWTEQGDYKFDPQYWPDPQAMVDELNDMGIELVASIWPTSNPNSENYRYMDDHNYLLRVENGLPGLQDVYGQQDYMDTLNPGAREHVWSLVRQNYCSYGIHHFWLDEAEPNMIPNHYDNVRCCRGNFAEFALLYPYYYEKMFYDGLVAEGQTEIISLSRAAYAGSQRFGALVWSGDVPSNFESLRMSVCTGLSMAMSGIPWWTTDIGGFWGGDPEKEEFRELLVRWFQFGVFCPVLRLHGNRNKSADHVDRHPGIQEPSGADNEIWSFGPRVYEILRDLIEMRERLRSYIMTYMEEARQTGVSIMRPLFMEYPDDPVTYTLEDEYLFGRDILFAPITAYRQTTRRVYLPAGTWISPRIHTNIEGGCWIEASAQLDEMIIYVREGAEVLSVF